MPSVSAAQTATPITPRASAGLQAQPGAGAPLKVLVLDDSSAQRHLLCAFLKKWGYAALSTGNPFEALEIMRTQDVAIVLCDWMMPEMTGPEFCINLRANSSETYAYVLLLTSLSEQGALAEGLASGADDFLNKPVRPPELDARIKAGARIVAMQREVRRKNALLEHALDDLQQVYADINRDLEEARRLQIASLQDTHRRFDGADVSLLLEASGHVGGDMVGYFQVSPNRVGLFSLDVAGHGVASAMMAARTAGMLSEASPDQNIALMRTDTGEFIDRPPEEVAARLNDLLLREMKTDRYFTLCLAFLDLVTGGLRIVQAGHPHPMILRADGAVETIGDGDMPIGLLPGIQYHGFEARLNPGDRLLLYSDGLTECPDPSGQLFDESGLAGMLRRHQDTRDPGLLQALRADLESFAGTDEFPDDISALLVEFTGQPDRA